MHQAVSKKDQHQAQFGVLLVLQVTTQSSVSHVLLEDTPMTTQTKTVRYVRTCHKEHLLIIRMQHGLIQCVLINAMKELPHLKRIASV
jgi:hypothetical protein